MQPQTRILVAVVTIFAMAPAALGTPTGSCVAGARFQNTMPPNNRKTVDISGGNLKTSAKAEDVQSFGTDDAGHNGPIHAAQSTQHCSGTQCTAVLLDGANWDSVSVQMRCADGQWSGWVQVQK